jgi:prefoldin subunit 5
MSNQYVEHLLSEIDSLKWEALNLKEKLLELEQALAEERERAERLDYELRQLQDRR